MISTWRKGRGVFFLPHRVVASDEKVKNSWVAVWTLALASLCVGVAAPAVPKFCSGCDFAGAKLSGSDFTRGTYIGVNFEGADLSGSSFRQGRFLAANFQNANLNGAAFDGAQCMACNFSGAKLEGATFSGVLMTAAANFKGFTGLITDEQLRQLLSGCVSCNFSGANMAGRDLSGIRLSRSTFRKPIFAARDSIGLYSAGTLSEIHSARRIATLCRGPN